jgi:hypothetical protein
MSEMKRLFVLRHNKGGAIIKESNGQPMYFGSKPEAKEARNLINQHSGNAVVSEGPDHRLFKGV